MDIDPLERYTGKVDPPDAPRLGDWDWRVNQAGGRRAGTERGSWLMRMRRRSWHIARAGVAWCRSALLGGAWWYRCAAPVDAEQQELAAIANHEPTLLWIALRLQRVERYERRAAISQQFSNTYVPGSRGYWNARLDDADIHGRLHEAREALRDAGRAYGARWRACGLSPAESERTAREIAQHALALTDIMASADRLPCASDFVRWASS